LEHEEAIESRAAERYVAHELPKAERDAFEDHFFDCPACADDVRWEQIFAANVRAYLRGATVARRASGVPVAARAGWFDRLRQWRPALPLAMSANFVLLAVIAGIYILPSHPPVPAQWTADEYFAPGPTHAADAVRVLPAGSPVYQVHFPGIGAATYSFEVIDSHGRRELSGSLAAPASQAINLHLTVSVGNLPSGVHTLLVQGMPGGEIVSRSRFQTSR